MLLLITTLISFTFSKNQTSPMTILANILSVNDFFNLIIIIYFYLKNI